eukprot:scaffold229_cov155-Ochromonas_danica.AAC.5
MANGYQAEDEEFLYRASDVLVQTTWELPIVVQCPRASVSYEFTSSPGDIAFGIVFVAAPNESQRPEDLDIETVEEMVKVPSSSDRISGSFDLPCEGVIFFLWDNTFAFWEYTKKITYSIKVHQPSFQLLDSERCHYAISQMRLVSEDLHEMCSKHADSNARYEHNCANASFLEHQIALLEEKLSKRREEFNQLCCEREGWQHSQLVLEEARAGLCIRMLSKPLLGFVFSFLPLDSCEAVASVSKYWCELIGEVLEGSPISKYPAKWYLGKADRSEKQRLLFEVKLRRQKAAMESTNSLSDSPFTPSQVSHVSEVRRPDEDVAREDISSSSSSHLKPPYDADLPNLPNQPIERDHLTSLASSIKEQKSDRGNGKGHRRQSKSKAKTQEVLLQNLQKIRSEQQLNTVMEYINASLLKIDSLKNEKRRVKKLIRAWNASYEKQHGRLPAIADRKGHLRELHEEYQQLALALRIRQDKLNDALKRVGLTMEDFEALRSQKFGDL